MEPARVGVMHLTDTLGLGGLERVAVNLANSLPRARYAAHLCATRREGPLVDLVAKHVGRLALRRRCRFDVAAVRRLVNYVRRHDIQILHAHGASLLVALAAAAVRPHPSVIWHIHSGLSRKFEWVFRQAVRRASFVIAVNTDLLEWARGPLAVAPERTRYLSNYVDGPDQPRQAPALPGMEGGRVVCVANLRPEKDSLTLLEAMRRVVARVPGAHLLLVGGWHTSAYVDLVRRAISEGHLEHYVSLLGPRADVGDILGGCAVGVLSSVVEGLPLALLEYGLAGLPVVATEVGYCPEVLDGGRAGLLVPARNPERLADAIVQLLESSDLRESLGSKLRSRVKTMHSRERAVEELCDVYEQVLSGSRHRVS